MNRGTRLLFTLGLLLLATHRAPAPISEVAKPTTTTRPKAKARPPVKKEQITSADNESRRSTKPAASFAGTWTGATHGQGHTTFGSQASSSTYSIQVSPDEKTLSVDQQGNYYSAVRLSQIACRRQAESLIWSYEGKALVRITGMCTLRLNADGSASLVDERRYHSVDKLVLKITGTLIRQ